MSRQDAPLPPEVRRALAQHKPIERFDLVERIVHWSTAIIMLELIATGAILYIPNLALAVGHRAIIENIHVFSGIGLLLPLIVGVLGPWRESLVADLRRFDQWTSADWDYFRRRKRNDASQLGKFNGGQKAEASLVGGGMFVMLATGVLMRYGRLSWNNWQQGATLVHDIGFFLIAVTIFVHISMAVNRPEQLKSMYRGHIPRSWAKAHAPKWLAEVDAEADS